MASEPAAAAINSALSAIAARSNEAGGIAVEVISAFTMPLLRFDTARKCFVPDPAAPTLFADADSHSKMYTNRLHMLEQRVRRHEMFKTPILANAVGSGQHLELTSIDALLGRGGTRVVLGMLSELEEGRVFLEDAHGNIELDLSSATTTAGLFTKHSIVLAEGEVLPSGVFKVTQLGFPPAEPRARTIEAFGAIDPLRPTPVGVTGASAAAAAAAAPPSAVALQHSMVVVLSELYLDKEEVLEKLAVVFNGYEVRGFAQPAPRVRHRA